MSSTLTPLSNSTAEALCLQDTPTATDLAIVRAPTLRDAIAAACLEMCEGRPDLLAYAMCSNEPGDPLTPLGKLFGDEAIHHGELASALFRLGVEGTSLSAAALRLGGPVWTDSIPRVGWKGLGRVLRDHGLQSAGAFPIMLGERVAALIEVLSFDKLQCDLASEALAADLGVRLARRYER
ncbi:MAG: hypothetical protein QOJ00_147 [Actinomycetota bacterium]|jgi:hypothetical protein